MQFLFLDMSKSYFYREYGSEALNRKYWANDDDEAAVLGDNRLIRRKVLQEKLHFHLHKRIEAFLAALNHQEEE